MFCASQPLILEIQPPVFVLWGTMLSKHLGSVPQPCSWAPWHRFSFVSGSEGVCFIYRGTFLYDLSPNKSEGKHIISFMWWIWIYIELNILLLLLNFHFSMQLYWSWACLLTNSLPLLREGRSLGGSGSQVLRHVFNKWYPQLATFVHNLYVIFCMCIPLVPLFTNLILNWLLYEIDLKNNYVKNCPCFNYYPWNHVFDVPVIFFLLQTKKPSYR